MQRAWDFASFLAAMVFVALCFAVDAHAVVGSDLYYASAVMGASNQPGGMSISNEQFGGVRFDVPTTVSIGAAGGHMLGIHSAPGNVFGAIVKFSEEFDFPDSANLSTPDVLRTFTFTPPTVSADIIVHFAPLTLTPGQYGVVFGSGLFGATGEAALPNYSDQPAIGSPAFFSWNPFNGWQGVSTSPFGNPRLTVYIPEPSIAWLCGILPMLRRRANRAAAPTRGTN